MNQVIAIFVDAYRELNARKLFWLTLAISLMVVVAFGSMGFTDKGVSMFFGLWEIEGFINANSPLARPLYIGIFSYFIVSIWLTWVATILALVSTTSIFPDFLAGGAIDIVLAKPISRLKLFSLKYVASLLFVVLQVAVFCTGIFLCIWWRLGETNFKIFLAIPIITVFFSYLFAFNVFVGIWTRSSLTALLLTMMFWFGIFSVTAATGILRTVQVEQEFAMERADTAITSINEKLADLPAEGENEAADARRTRMTSQLELEQEQRDQAQESWDKLDVWYRPISYGLVVLPKTSATVALVARQLDDPTGLDILDILEGAGRENGTSQQRQNADARVREESEQESLWYIMGSSLIFEFVVLGFAALMFCRRDF